MLTRNNDSDCPKHLITSKNNFMISSVLQQAAAAAMDPTGHHGLPTPGAAGGLGDSRYPWMSITGECIYRLSLCTLQAFISVCLVSRLFIIVLSQYLSIIAIWCVRVIIRCVWVSWTNGCSYWPITLTGVWPAMAAITILYHQSLSTLKAVKLVSLPTCRQPARLRNYAVKESDVV